MVMQNLLLPDKPIGAVFTPLPWARWLVRQLDVVPKWVAGSTVCDPTAGEGVFIHALMDEATGQGLVVSMEMVSRLFVIEREKTFIKKFQESFCGKYGFNFPAGNIFCTDIVLENPGRKFDFLIGNPPWANFCDLPLDYKNILKKYFGEYGLLHNRQALLLGSSRVDFSALVISVVLNENLAANGEAVFFVPLSLFLNDGAHAGFRRYMLKDVPFRLVELWDFNKNQIFLDVMTRFGVARFQKDKPTVFPISYRTSEDGQWTENCAAPVSEATGPLSVFSSPAEYELLADFAPIEVRESQTPRQGVNTGGANDVFIFDSVPEEMPSEFFYPLMTKECFRNQHRKPKKHVLLPYNRKTGKPLEEAELSKHPALWKYLLQKKNILANRKGTLLNTWIKRNIWWACLGVGKYNFAPFKIAWEAYGKNTFNPAIYSSIEGQPWQANQSLHSFIPCDSEDEAELLLRQLSASRIEKYLRSMNIGGTCNWAQPGRIKRFLKFAEEVPSASPEFQFA